MDGRETGQRSHIVELEGVAFERGGGRIIQPTSLAIASGQHTALLGANGSGKTTLLKLIAGYEWPSQGTVRVLGRVYGSVDLPKLRRQFGWVSMATDDKVPGRDAALRVVASGFEASFGLYHEIPAYAWDRARAALHALGGAYFADRPYRLLSQGEQQRTRIARALVHGPKLLILDEPCAGLDPAARASLLSDLDRLAEGPRAPVILLVTHHVEEIRPWVRQALALREGRILAGGAPAEVLTGAILSATFDCACAVERINGVYRLEVAAPPTPNQGEPPC
jgi:iron complex transport system ATP-binding protein